jgi:hypothetical protein
VRAAGGATMRVVLGEPGAIEREADLLERIGGTGHFPASSECGVDDVHGSYLAMAAPPAEARPLSEVGAGLTLATAIGVLRALVDAAQVIEKIGFAWEPQRDDVHVRPDGSIKISRVRVPRKLGHGERLDARAVVEAVGPTFVPTPALEGPSRAFRLLLPHVPIPGDAGNSIVDVRREIAAVELDLAPPTDDGLRVAGVCDPGLRRPHNEDASPSPPAPRTASAGRCSSCATACPPRRTPTGRRPSRRRPRATTLAQSARAGDVSVEAGKTAVAQAIRAAHAAVCAQPVEVAGEDPPGTTIVVALVWRQRLTVGWVGDSRAYWISEDDAEQLTHDHSWAVEAVLARRGHRVRGGPVAPVARADAVSRAARGRRSRTSRWKPGRGSASPRCSRGSARAISPVRAGSSCARTGSGTTSPSRPTSRPSCAWGGQPPRPRVSLGGSSITRSPAAGRTT